MKHAIKRPLCLTEMGKNNKQHTVSEMKLRGFDGLAGSADLSDRTTITYL